MIDLVVLCDWLPPDFGAVGQYTLKTARERARGGENVALYGLTSSSQAPEIERFASGSLKVVRIKAALYDRASFRARAWWTLRTNLSLVRHAWADARTSRELMFTGSPPFLLHFVAPLNLLLRKRLTYRITDFFPECWMAEYTRVPFTLRLLHRLTLFWRRRVDRFEVLGEDARKRLLEVGIPAERIVLKRDPSPVEISPHTLPLERPAELRGYKVLLYSGNFGVAHDHETFLEGYAKHHRDGSRRVALWLNATGARADALEHALRSAGLPHLRSRPLPLERLASLLVTADTHLITLRDAFSGFVIPSKVYGCIDSGRPILYIGPQSSDVHLLCSAVKPAERYTHVKVGDGNGVFGALENI